MERKIGERFEYKGTTLEVTENNNCIGCYFNKFCNIERCEIGKVTGPCSYDSRIDYTNVVFREV